MLSEQRAWFGPGEDGVGERGIGVEEVGVCLLGGGGGDLYPKLGDVAVYRGLVVVGGSAG